MINIDIRMILYMNRVYLFAVYYYVINENLERNIKIRFYYNIYSPRLHTQCRGFFNLITVHVTGTVYGKIANNAMNNVKIMII